jgi:predicted transcriptional regulator
MPKLNARCTPETKAAFKALAAGHDLTESELLRQVIAAIVKRQPLPGTADRPFAGARAGYTGELHLRLRKHEIQRIHALAEPAGQSGPAWVVALIRERLGDATPFVASELDELAGAVRELGAVGRNLNLIAHRLMRTDQYSAQALQPERLAARVEAVHAAVRAMASRAASRVGANDARG